MLISADLGASASTVPPAASPEPPPNRQHESVRHLLFGSRSGVQATILQLHKQGYAEPNDWSQPIATGRPNEVMAILTRRVRRVV